MASMWWFIQAPLRATIQNNQDGYINANNTLDQHVLVKNQSFTGAPTPLHTIVDVFVDISLVVALLRFYEHPLASRDSFLHVRWYFPVEIKSTLFLYVKEEKNKELDKYHVHFGPVLFPNYGDVVC